MGRQKGFKHSPETIERMKAAKIGHETNDETRLKISQANIGRKRTPAAIERIRMGAIRREAEKARIRQENKQWKIEKIGDIIVLSNNVDNEKIIVKKNKII